MDWKADSLQGVLFPLPNSKPMSALEAWKLLAGGEEPDAYQKPAISPIAASQASGSLYGEQLGVSAQPGRIDFFISPHVGAQMPASPPQIKDYKSSLDALHACMLSVLKKVQVSRVSVLSEFSAHCKDDATAQRLLTEFSGVQFPVSSSDHVYQFNTKRNFKSFKQYGMNRLINWASGYKQMIAGPAVGIGMPFNMMQSITTPIATLKIDINSSTTSDITSHAKAMLEEEFQEIFAIYSNDGRITQ